MVIKYSNIFRTYIGVVCAGMSVGGLCAEGKYDRGNCDYVGRRYCVCVADEYRPLV